MGNQKRIYDAIKRDTSIGPRHELISDFASQDGSGVTFAANGDYSGAGQLFRFGPPAGENWQVERLIVLIEDGNMPPDEYGELGALTNGIQVIVTGDSRATNVISGSLPIKTNTHWSRRCFDGAPIQGFAAGNSVFRVRWTFERAGQDIRLVGDENDHLDVRLDDNFSGLVDHTFFFDGYKE
jgi:hypothetical protein